MKVKKTTVEEIDVEMSFPMFLKQNDYCYYKVIDENNFIRVINFSALIKFGIEYDNNKFVIENIIANEQVTESEFMAMYNHVKDKL